MTKVIFRRTKRAWGNEIVAIFPEIAGDLNPYQTCLCYAHIGQHSAIDLNYVEWSSPANPEEYKDLYDELVSIGYDDLKIAKRITRKDFLARKEQTQ